MGALYGRAAEIERARSHVRAARAGAGSLVLLTGEPGIGKSRLAEHLAGLAAAEGAQVFWGRCWEAGGAPAYWPWIQIFRALEMDEDPFAVAPDVGGTAEQARFQLFDLAVRRLGERAALAPIALVLDDLHAADLPSLLLLLLLVRDLRRRRILVIGTSRDAEVRLVPEAAALLAKIGREGDVLALGRLEARDVQAWLQEARPSATARQKEVLYQVTEGHPLFITEMLGLGAPEGSRGPLLDNLGAMLDERTLALPEPTRALLEVAAVLGREFSVAELAVLSGQPADEVERRLREARAAGVVAGGAVGSYLFTHVLRRDRIYAELPPSRRAALHWMVGTSRLERGLDPAAAVHHLLEGESAGDAAKAAEVALTAAESALTRYAFEEAARLARRASQLLPPAASTRLSCQLRLNLAEALIRLGQGAEGRAVAVAAAESARQLGAADLLARAALAYGAEQVAGPIDHQMVALLREALASLEPADSAVRARLTARLGAALMPPKGREDYLHNVGLAHQATAMARRLEDWHTLLYVLQNSLNSFGFVMPNDERALLLQEIVDLAGSLGQRLVLINNLGPHGLMLTARGHPVEGELALAQLEQLLVESSHPLHQWRPPLARALLAALNTDFVEADWLSERAHQLATQSPSHLGILAWAFQRVSLALLRGEPGAFANDAPAVLDELAKFPQKLALAMTLAALGRREEATRSLQDATFEPGDVISVIGGAMTCLLVGDTTQTAERVYRSLVQVAQVHRLFWGPALGSVFGPVPRLAGEMALLLGRPEEALRHHDEAQAVCAVIRSPALLALCTRSRDQALARMGAALPPPAPALPAPRIDLRREGDVWALTRDDRPPIRLKHSKGLGYLDYLLQQPGRETHVLELVGTEHATGDAGPVLDARAKTEYRERLDELKEELEEGARFGDRERVARAQEQIEAIAEQLAGAVGLGGRDRRAASDVERARVNVQRRLKDTVDRITAADPALGRYLTAALRTGTYCSFSPI